MYDSCKCVVSILPDQIIALQEFYTGDEGLPVWEEGEDRFVFLTP